MPFIIFFLLKKNNVKMIWFMMLRGNKIGGDLALIGLSFGIDFEIVTALQVPIC